MQRIYILLAFFLVLIGEATAQQNKALPVSVENLRRHLTIVASDSMAGRSFSTETPGLEYAAEYIEKQAGQIGLKPPGNGYTQKFNVIKSQPKPGESKLIVWDENDGAVYKTDSLVSLTRGKENMHTTGDAVFAGFGETDEITSAVKGKVAVFAVGTSEKYKEDKPAKWHTDTEVGKVNKAAELGALAAVLITSPKDTYNNTYNRIKYRMNRPGYLLETGSAFETIPVVLATPHVGCKLLGTSYREYISSVAEKTSADTFSQKKVQIELKIEKETEILAAKNIVGIVEGSDPDLKKECVVYMAHYDHLGTSDGEIFNGADDNGSGTVALLEIARAYASLKNKPARSIVFAWVTGEEVGLLGSDYYTQHPVFPLEKTVACINLDMVGRVYEARDSVWRKSPKQVKNFDGVYTLTSDFFPRLEILTDSVCNELALVPDKSLPDYFFRTSDHHHFHSKSVPILNLATGYHADYHKVTDEVSKINFDKIKRVADLAFLVGRELANQHSEIKNTEK